MKKYLVFVSLVLTSCADHHDSVKFSSSAGCSVLDFEGIDIGIVNNSDAWLVNWNSDRLTLKQAPKNQFEITMTIQAKHQIVVDTWLKRLDGTLINEDQIRSSYRYDEPISIAATNEFLLVGYYSEHKYENKQFGLVYIDVQNRRIVNAIEVEKRVLSVALSVDGRHFATLEKSRIRNGKKSVVDYFAEVMGHGIPYSDLVVNIYDVNGQILCSAKVASDLSYADGYVSWNGSDVN